MRRLLFALFAAVLAAGAAHAQGAYKAPRNGLGQPDFEGYWSSSSLTRLERPSYFKDLAPSESEARAFEAKNPQVMEGGLRIPPPGEAIGDVGGITRLEDGDTLARIGGKPRSSWIVDPIDGKLPWRPEGRKLYDTGLRGVRQFFDGPEGRPMAERCIIGYGSVGGPPLLNVIYNGNYQIQQSKDAFVILVEMNHDARIIRLNQKEHLPDNVRPWLGDTIGHWEGDTLVAETTNFNPGETLRASWGHFLYISKDAKIVERFTRISPTQILYEYVVDDPAIYTRPWRAQMPLNISKSPIYEYACHEGNYGLANILAGARKVESEGRKPEGMLSPGEASKE